MQSRAFLHIPGLGDRGAAQLGINPVWGFLLQLEWRDAGSGSGRLGRAGSYRGPTGPPLMQSYSEEPASLSLIPIIQAADNDPNSDCTRRPTHRSYVPTTEELS